jgi:hypothetical protein
LHDQAKDQIEIKLFHKVIPGGEHKFYYIRGGVWEDKFEFWA